jgi:hypothetical protein
MWETNDDIGMSMVAHGYGIASSSSPNLIFSNVIWGYLVRLIPEINGVLGYSIATIWLLLITGTTMSYGLYRLDIGWVPTFLVVSLALLRPILIPQFTVIAGLLTVCALICLSNYERGGSYVDLILGALLAYLGFLVRSEESLLVFLVALPFLKWKYLLKDKYFKITFLIFNLAIITSLAINYQAYRGPEWVSFNELKSSISSIVDFGAGDYLKIRPDILAKYTYSLNDIDLIKSWFFIDLNIANPNSLKEMLSTLGPLSGQNKSLRNGWDNIVSLLHPPIFIYIFMASLVLTILPSWRLALIWMLCIAAIFALGLMGRPGITRVQYPLVIFLLIVPFFLNSAKKPIKLFLISSLLLVVTLINGRNVIFDIQNNQILAKEIQSELASYPKTPVVIWGAIFPYERVYPMLQISPSVKSYVMISLGAFTLAPFSNSFALQDHRHWLIDKLTQPEGISIIANSDQLKYLEIYCNERLHGQLIELSVEKYGRLEVSKHYCRVIK